MTNANGVVVDNSFDLINRLTNRNWLSGGSVYASENFGYATNGLIAYTNQDGQWTHFGRDGASRLIALTNAVLTNLFGYDGLDDLISLTDGLSQKTTWGFNQYGWLTSKTNNLNVNIINYTYDADGRVTNRWMMGTNTGYKFDAVGNLTNINYPAKTVVFGYDAINELTSMTDPVGTTTFIWTSNGLLASEASPWSSDTLSYGYSQGHRTNISLTQPSGGPWTQTYGYDSAWRMTGITSSAGTFGYAYPFAPQPVSGRRRFHCSNWRIHPQSMRQSGPVDQHRVVEFLGPSFGRLCVWHRLAWFAHQHHAPIGPDDQQCGGRLRCDGRGEQLDGQGGQRHVAGE